MPVQFAGYGNRIAGQIGLGKFRPDRRFYRSAAGRRRHPVSRAPHRSDSEAEVSGGALPVGTVFAAGLGEGDAVFQALRNSNHPRPAIWRCAAKLPARKRKSVGERIIPAFARCCRCGRRGARLELPIHRSRTPNGARPAPRTGGRRRPYRIFHRCQTSRQGLGRCQLDPGACRIDRALPPIGADFDRCRRRPGTIRTGNQCLDWAKGQSLGRGGAPYQRPRHARRGVLSGA